MRPTQPDRLQVILPALAIGLLTAAFIIAKTGALAGLLIDTQFYIIAAMANKGERGNAAFFANFYIMLNLGSLLLQVFLARGASFAAAAATALSRSALKVTGGGLRSAIHRSIWEQAFLPIGAHESSQVKLTVDGMASGPINTSWLAITRRMRVQMKTGLPAGEVDCARFPDQCPCTTKLGKGVP